MARVDGETRSIWREKSCCEEEVSNSGWTQLIFTVSTKRVLESWCGMKSWPDVWKMTDCQQSRRQLEKLAEGPMLKEMERWTSCRARKSQCSRNVGAKGLALLPVLPDWNGCQRAFSNMDGNLILQRSLPWSSSVLNVR